LSLPGFLYGHVARLRRQWYARHAEARRGLRQPVISVGNLTVGGSGKTPAVAHLARVLSDLGERPSVLSRGYKRAERADGVVVVSDGRTVRADLRRSGDEPMMLARSLQGVPVLVAEDRHLAGRLAEVHLGCSVHLLDDGFQHLELRRDVDLVLAAPSDMANARPLPSGRLREPLSTLRFADALIVPEDERGEGEALARRYGVMEVFQSRRTLLPAQWTGPFGGAATIEPGPAALAIAGIAGPERFFADLRSAGWALAGEMSFGDHRRYTPADVRRIAERALTGGADIVLVTEKDFVRLLPFRPFPFRLAWVPLRFTIEPAAAFQAWVLARLAAARGQIVGLPEVAV
jgi:tetraacyldisaccharide 4'-kinase